VVVCCWAVSSVVEAVRVMTGSSEAGGDGGEQFGRVVGVRGGVDAQPGGVELFV
jgi:hypothetical protein